MFWSFISFTGKVGQISELIHRLRPKVSADVFVAFASGGQLKNQCAAWRDIILRVAFCLPVQVEKAS